MGFTRDALPHLDRDQDHGLRRAVVHQRRLLQHVVPHLAGDDRPRQLPGNRSPGRRRSPPGTTACSPRRSWSRSTGRSARTSACWAPPALRSRGRSSATQPRPAGPRRAPPPAAREEPATTCAPWGSRCWSVDPPLRFHALAMAAWTSTAGRRAASCPLRPPRCSPSATSSWWSGPSPASARSAPVLLDLRPLLLAARAFWKVLRRRRPLFAGTPFKTHLAPARRPDRPRVFDDGCSIAERTLARSATTHAQRGQHDPVPLAGGRHLQIRPHHDRRRLHPGGRCLRPLRRDHRRRRRARRRLLPHEGRGDPAQAQWGGNPAREMGGRGIVSSTRRQTDDRLQ